MSDEQILYDPAAEPRILASGLAPRLAVSRASRTCSTSAKANAGTLMSAVTARLEVGVRDVVNREKGIAGAPSPTSSPRSTTCNFVLVGSAD